MDYSCQAGSLEAVSKPQIAFEGKLKIPSLSSGVSSEFKTERTRQYVSISIRGTIPPAAGPSGVRWGFEMASILKLVETHSRH
jgi:hypothetical protein